MITREGVADLEALVKQRTRELRADDVGYADAVRALAEELYKLGRGKATRLGEMGATARLLGSALGGGDTDGMLFAKTKKAKASAIAALERLVSPWVSDLYEAASGA